MAEKKQAPRFMIDAPHGACSPVTEYTAKKDGSFTAKCYSIPGFELEGENFEATVDAATKAYMAHCRMGIWN